MDDLRYQIDLLTVLNQKISNSEKMYRTICECSYKAFVYINYANNVFMTLGRWDDFFDIKINDASELIKLVDFFEDEQSSDLRRLLYIEKEGKDRESLEFSYKDKKKFANIEVIIKRDSEGNISEKVVSFADVTKNRIHKDELTYLAYYDLMTGLYNRNYFIIKLKEFVERAKKENSIVSVLLIDIDDFHKISDSKGLVIGDEIIQNLGLYLHELTENYIIGSRFDSDIFYLAVYDPCGHRSIDTLYRSIKDFLSNPMRLTDGTEVSISVSVGVAEFPEASDNALQLINCAEIVMLKAKEAGKDTIKFFDSSILNNFLRDVSIENKLKEAVFDNKFFLNFQPQYITENKHLRGVEALVRWQDTDGRFISPAVFIPISERNGSIIQIGDFVLDEAIRTYMEWKKKFNYSFVLSVNISSVQYNRPNFVSKVISTLKKYEMNPEDLELEITESLLIDDFKMVIQKMCELRDYGIKISLDDFGTGFSSLSYLKGLPIDTIKIDKAFVDSINSDNSARIIINSIVSMSKQLGYETVAEGVEDEKQFDYLESINCDIIQGYYLGKPLMKSEIEELLLRLI